MNRLNGRVAVVTGGASGIGRGIATALAREGADVIVADRVSEAQAGEVCAEIVAAGRSVHYVQTDVAEESSVRTMAERAVTRFGHVDILVNNAGIFSEARLADMAVEEWGRVGYQSAGPFLFARFLIGPMLTRGDGLVINIASQPGQIGGVSPGPLLGQQGPTDRDANALAGEVAHRGVLVNGGDVML